MPGKAQPLQSDQKIVNPDGTPTVAFIRWAQERQADIVAGQSASGVSDAIDNWAANRQVEAGSGLEGGGYLSADVTIAMSVIAGVAGSYTNVNVTVDQQGRVTAIADGAPPGIADAPSDGQKYARMNGAWVVIP